VTGDPIATLLERRLVEAGQDPEAPVSVAELHRVLLPYSECRTPLGFVTKAEYDLALLRLLADADRMEIDDELASAVEAELRAPEPGLAFLKNFAAARLRVRRRAVPAARHAGSDPWMVSEEGEIEAPSPAPAPPPAPAARSEAATIAEAEVEAKAEARAECWRCAERLPSLPDVSYCPHCGTDQTIRPCDDCGAQLELAWSYCPRCGTAVA